MKIWKKTIEKYYRRPQWIEWLVSGTDIRRCDVKTYPSLYIVDSILCYPSSNICMDRSRPSEPLNLYDRAKDENGARKLVPCLYQLHQNSQSYTVRVARLVEWQTVNAWELSRWSRTVASVDKQVSCAGILGMGNNEITSHLASCTEVNLGWKTGKPVLLEGGHGAPYLCLR